MSTRFKSDYTQADYFLSSILKTFDMLYISFTAFT